jgi:hypothetical protein
MVPEADDTSKSDTVIGDAEGGGWCLKVKDDKRKLGRGLNAWLGQTADWASEKNMAESMRWARKISEGIPVSQNGMKIQIEKHFCVAKNWKFDSNGFFFFKTYTSEILFCLSCRVEQNGKNKI